MFEILAGEPFLSSIPWDCIKVFWGDDRAVPPDHEYSNYKLAFESLLQHVPVQEKNIFRIKGELGAKEAAEGMRCDLASEFHGEALPRFDLLIQGLGTDGHTASLFPGTDALKETDWVVPVFDPPANPGVDRVTLTFSVLNNARCVLFLVAGADKKPLIDAVLNDPAAGEKYPAAAVEGEEIIWFVDRAAFGFEAG